MKQYNSFAQEQTHLRSFLVWLNDTEEHLDNAVGGERLPARPLVKKFIVNVSGGKVLTIDFTPLAWRTLLNAIRIFKNI